MKNNPTKEQEKILENQKKKLIVSASAGSGKTFVVIEYLIKLICEKKIPVSKFLVLTFTKAAANEMKTRLYNAMLEQKPTEFLLEQIDDISQSDISTIDAFCEKIIKRNINKLELDENFSILDEKASKSLKLTSFERAYEEFYEKDKENFDVVYFAFRKNKNFVYECMLDLQSFFDSNFEGEDLVDQMINNSQTFKEKGEKYFMQYISHALSLQKKKLLLLNNLPEAYEIFKQKLIAFCDQNLSDEFIDFVAQINNFEFGNMPRNKTEDTEQKQILIQCKDALKDIKDMASIYDGIDKHRYEKLNKNDLPSALLKLYKVYSDVYRILKNNRTALDFADLEKIAKKLLQDSEILNSLQEKYDYIFIDEYQDTNFLQEAIIKPIADKGYFIAVGDPKQGIYGFRNASMEIMKNDIESFSNGKESDALFLTGNFRSDERVLNFINKIFVKIMTLESVGIDYKNTSTLKGLGYFEKDKLPPVCVDVILAEDVAEEACGIYSVKEDKLTLSDKNKSEVKDIARRIEQALQSNIYDAKQKAFRRVQPNDIAVLFRNRSLVMQETVKFLQERGFNIVADIKQSLLEDSEIRVLLALLKITFNMNDDISLASVMNSWFGKFSLDELLSISKSAKDKSFNQIIMESEDQKLLTFKNDIKNFYFDCQVMGLTKALNRLFAQKEFYLYLNSISSASMKKIHLNEFFKLIKNGDFEFDVPSLIEYLEKNEVGGEINEQSTNAITITTIHATKGLEYPIVILAGSGEKLKKPYTKQYAISKEFGLTCDLYDFDENEKVKSPSFLSTKLLRDKKEFVEEIMVFYVALTRAQNHLFIIGSQGEKQLKIRDNVFECQTYLDMIFSALGKDFTKNLFANSHKKFDEVEFNIIDNVDEIKKTTQQEKESFELTIEDLDKIERYIDFVYKDKDKCCYPFKNSVSGVLHLDEQKELFLSAGGEISEKAILRGNAYHEALKLLNFQLINSKEDIEKQKEFLVSNLTEGYFELIDKNILWNNIKILKELIGNQEVIKERQFIMQTSLDEAGIAGGDQQVIVQGIIDLFSLGEKNILVDYKYTSEKDDNKLIQRYAKQIYLYSLAIEKAFNKKIDEKYLLSLKDCRLLKIKE